MQQTNPHQQIKLTVGDYVISIISGEGSYSYGDGSKLECAVWRKSSEHRGMFNREWVRIAPFMVDDDVAVLDATEIATLILMVKSLAGQELSNG